MPAPIHLSFPDVTALLPSSKVAIKPPPEDNTLGVFLTSAFQSVQAGVREYRDAKQFQSELDGYANFYRSKGLTDVADLITLQKNNANPDIPGALAGADTSRKRQQMMAGLSSIGERELMFRQQQEMQKQSFANQTALQTASDSNIRSRQDEAFDRDKQMLAVKASLNGIDDSIKSFETQINDIATSPAMSDDEKRTALINLQAAKEAEEKKREGILSSLNAGTPVTNSSPVNTEGFKASEAGPDGSDGLPSDPPTKRPSADLLPAYGDMPIDLSPTEQPEEKKAGSPLPAGVEAKMKIADGNKQALIESTQAELASVGANIQASLKEGRINKEQYDALVAMSEQIKGNSLKGDIKAVRYGINELQQQSKVYAARPAREAIQPTELNIPGLKDASGNAPIRFIIKGDRLSIQTAGSNRAEDITLIPGQEINLRQAAINSLLSISDKEQRERALKEYKTLLDKLPESTTLEKLQGLSSPNSPSPTPATGSGLTDRSRGILDRILKGNN